VRKGINRSVVVLVLLCCTLPVQAMDIMILGLFKDTVILRIDGVQHKLSKGQTSPEGVTLINADSDKAVLDIAGQRQAFTLGSHTRNISTRRSAGKQSGGEARIWSNRGMYTTVGTINGMPVNFLVDTGATWVAMSAEQARRLGINYRYAGKKGMAGTANGVTETYVVNLKSVRVGDIEVNNIEGAVIEGRGPDTVLLGMSFLSKVKMQHEDRLLLLSK